MHPITRREKLKKDLTDLNYFAKKVIFAGIALCDKFLDHVSDSKQPCGLLLRSARGSGIN